MPRFLQWLFGVTLVLTALPASAAFSLTAGYPRREGGDGRPIATSNPLAEPRAGFNRADCLDTKQRIQLHLSDVPAEATDVEVWVRRDNTSCADPANRSGGANVQCWRAAHWTRDQIVGKIGSLSPAQVIAAIDKHVDVDTAGSLDVDATCAEEASMTPARFFLQIMAFNSGAVLGWTIGSGSTAAVIVVPTAYDLAGPNPPKLESVAAANSSFDLMLAGTTTPVADFAGYDVYCFPTTSSTCAGHPLVAGKTPTSELDAHICSTGTASADGDMTVIGVKNGTSYAVAVAARDKAANVGVFSNVVCATPVGPLSTDTPPAAADTVKGGCSTATSMPASPFALAALGLALAACVRRRARG